MAGFYGRTGIEIKDTLAEGIENAALRVRPAAIAACEAAAGVILDKAYGYANVSPGVQGHGIHGEHMRDELRLDTREYDNGVSTRIFISMVTIPYAAHQEFGPRGNRFLTRAIDETRDEAHLIMKAVFSAEFKDGKFSTKVRMRSYA